MEKTKEAKKPPQAITETKVQNDDKKLTERIINDLLPVAVGVEKAKSMQVQNDTDAILSTIIENLKTKQACLSGLCIAKNQAHKRRLKEHYDSKVKSLDDQYREKLAKTESILKEKTKKQMKEIEEERDKLKMQLALMNENVSVKQYGSQPVHNGGDIDSKDHSESDDEPKMTHASSTTNVYNIYVNEFDTKGNVIINQQSTEEWLKLGNVNLLTSFIAK